MAVSNVVYNVNVKSKFELFLNEDFCDAEPEELVKKISEDKKKKELAYKESKKQKHNEVKKIVPKANTDKESLNIENKLSNDKAPRFQKSEAKTSLKPKNLYQRATVHVSKPNEEDISDEKNHDMKSKKTFVSTSKKVKGREFDRHSGSDKTGVKSVERRDGSGAYNWGNVKDLVDLSQERTVAELKDENSDDKSIVPEIILDSVKKDEEKTVMTMSEWKALHVSDNVVPLNVPNRPANNGEDVFSGMNVYKKKNIHHSESDSELVIPEDDIDSKGRRPIKVNIEFSGRNGRDRGGYNNSRFRKDDNSGAIKDGIIINLDEEEFPTLS